MAKKTSSFQKRPRKKQVVSPETGTNPLTIKSILVPLDFSPASFKALDYALPLAEGFGARVHLVHAFDFDYPSSILAAMPIILSEATLVCNAKRHLTGIAKKFAIPVQNLHIVQGRAYRTICELAQKLGTDLIVTAACGRSALENVLLGSTAERDRATRALSGLGRARATAQSFATQWIQELRVPRSSEEDSCPAGFFRLLDGRTGVRNSLCSGLKRPACAFE